MRPLDRFVAWVRRGYPAGVPDRDFVPLFALLHRRLGDEEIEDLGRELAARGVIPADKIDVGVGILQRTDEVPSEDEMRRVETRLREGGWEIEDSPADGGPAAG